MYENLTRLDLLGPALARALGDPGWERLEASLISGGKSNLTFELTSDAGEAVLRRPPDGPLLPRAHDMAREARVQRALAATAVPVPAILFEDAGELIGVPFYVMEKVDGYVVRDALPAGYAESPRGPPRHRRRPGGHAGGPARGGSRRGRPVRFRPAVRPGGAAGAPVERAVGAFQEPGRPGRRRTRPPAARGPAGRARGSDRARGLPDRQLPAGQADAADRGGRARLGTRHAGRAASRSGLAAVLLAAGR